MNAMQMRAIKRSTLISVVGLGLASFAAGISYAASKAKEAVAPAEKMQFKQVLPGVSKATLWGDDTKGAYGTMTRFAPGTNNPLHSHQNDLKLVVIEGAYIYGTENGETRLGRGSYILIPGGKQHTSRADGDTLFFEESVGKFTFDPVKKP